MEHMGEGELVGGENEGMAHGGGEGTRERGGHMERKGMWE